MDEQDLDEWFNERKNQLERKIYKELDKAKDKKPIVAKFDRQYKALLRQFQSKQAGLYAQQLRREKINKPIKQIEEKWKDIQLTVINKYKVIKAKIKKYFFDKKIKKILKNEPLYK
jgi:hypothetical protein